MGVSDQLDVAQKFLTHISSVLYATFAEQLARYDEACYLYPEGFWFVSCLKCRFS
jgi:hypothetical protein